MCCSCYYYIIGLLDGVISTTFGLCLNRFGLGVLLVLLCVGYYLGIYYCGGGGGGRREGGFGGGGGGDGGFRSPYGNGGRREGGGGRGGY